MRIRASAGTGTGCCDSMMPACSNRVDVRCFYRGNAITASISPMLNDAFMSRNHGNTTV
jgi:hypothetical protein